MFGITQGYASGSAARIITQGYDSNGTISVLWLPRAIVSALITANTNPFGIDSEQTTLMNPDNDPFFIDPGQTSALITANANPFGIDSEQTTLIP